MLTQLRLIAILFLTLGTPLAFAEMLILLGGDTFAPFAYVKDGKPAGAMVKVFERAAQLSGDSYTIELMPWKRALARAEQAEAGIFGLSFTAERARAFDYSQSMYDNSVQVVVRAGKGFPFKKVADLKGKVMGGLYGASYGEEIDRAIASGLITVDRDYAAEGRLLKLLSGRIDAALVDGGQIGLERALSATAELRQNRDTLEVLATPLVNDSLHLAFAKGMKKTAAIDRFNAALDKLRKSGELAKIYAQAAQ